MKKLFLLLVLFVTACKDGTFIDQRYNQKFTSPDGTVPHRLLKSSEPEWPEKAKSLGIEGYVVLTLDISADGIPDNVEAIESDPEEYFVAYAIDAAKKWVYKPAKKNGEKLRTENVTTFIGFCLEASHYQYRSPICYDQAAVQNLRAKYSSSKVRYVP